MPFSDPLADGPVIQAAGERALAAGATFEGICEQVARAAQQQRAGDPDVLHQPDPVAGVCDYAVGF